MLSITHQNYGSQSTLMTNTVHQDTAIPRQETMLLSFRNSFMEQEYVQEAFQWGFGML